MITEDPTLARLAAVAGATQEARVIGDAAVTITDLHHDSKMVEAGTAFVAIVGAVVDGHDFASAAIDRGASALIVQRPLEVEAPQLVVEATRPLMAGLAAEVHGHPSAAMAVIGVTGTNGKTTVTHMIESIADTGGRRSGLMGTLGARIGGMSYPIAHTTPEATDVQRLLHRMVDAGVDIAAMEVSSHALAYGRADSIGFAVAAFTNLSQDHLDFHGDMEEYFAVKKRLFDPGRCHRAVVYTDDQWGGRLVSEIEIPVTTVGFEGDTDVRGLDLHLNPTMITFDVESRIGMFPVEVPLGGRFNAANALVAAACAVEVGLDGEAIGRGLAELAPVPGRFETVDEGQPFTVIVDYAHTPQAMATVIDAVRPAPPGRLVAVGGAGGDRDREKRPLMGAALAAADIAVVTSDNPRSEDPAGIVAAVAAGAVGDAEVIIEIDRGRAIEIAIDRARPGDVVVLLGKGHEAGQEVGGRVLPFDDRLAAVGALRRRGDDEGAT